MKKNIAINNKYTKTKIITNMLKNKIYSISLISNTLNLSKDKVNSVMIPLLNDELAKKAMRPSLTFNKAIESLN